jgi:hypothetical protein
MGYAFVGAFTVQIKERYNVSDSQVRARPRPPHPLLLSMQREFTCATAADGQVGLLFSAYRLAVVRRAAPRRCEAGT